MKTSELYNKTLYEIEKEGNIDDIARYEKIMNDIIPKLSELVGEKLEKNLAFEDLTIYNVFKLYIRKAKVLGIDEKILFDYLFEKSRVRGVQ